MEEYTFKFRYGYVSHITSYHETESKFKVGDLFYIKGKTKFLYEVLSVLSSYYRVKVVSITNSYKDVLDQNSILMKEIVHKHSIPANNSFSKEYKTKRLIGLV